MKKIRCYYKYIFNLYLVLGVITFILAILPLIIDTNEGLNIKLAWSISMALFSLIMIYAYFYHKHTLFCTTDKFVLRNPFGVLQTLDPKKCIVEIVLLPTEYSWVGNTNRKWICIYEKNNAIKKFKTGVSNSKKYTRIQVIHNDLNESIINDFLDSDN